MKRKAIDELIRWNKSECDKPALLTGGKGVGKTYLAYDFAKAFFESINYINLERERGVYKLFDTQQSNELSTNLYNYLGITKEKARKGILILDEVTFCPSAAKWLVPLQRLGIFKRVIVIADCIIDNIDTLTGKTADMTSSRTTDTSNRATDTYQSSDSARPVTTGLSSLHIINIYPLQFDEFLLATSNDWYVDAVKTHFESDKPLPEIVHKELLELYDLYVQIGGMPQAVNEYISMSSIINVMEQQDRQLSVFYSYIAENNSEGLALKMKQVLDCVPLQLYKENRKFQYKLIRKGTTHAMYKDAITKLSQKRLLLECFRVNEKLFPQLHTSPEDIDMDVIRKEAGTGFKLYYPDTGLLYSRLSREPQESSNSLARKAILEHYVAQSLCSKGNPLLFWESASMAKIEFLLPASNGIIPVEIHDSTNTRSKSINIFQKKEDIPYAIKISPRNFEFTGQIKYVPNYAVFCI